MTQYALTGGNEGIGTDPPEGRGVIIAAVAIVEAGFGIVVVTAIAEGVLRRRLALNGGTFIVVYAIVGIAVFTPCIVPVIHYDGAAFGAKRRAIQRSKLLREAFFRVRKRRILTPRPHDRGR